MSQWAKSWKKVQFEIYIWVGIEMSFISKTYNTFHPWQRNDSSKIVDLMQKNAYFPGKIKIKAQCACLQYAYAPFVEALLHEFGALWSIDFHA